MGPKLAPERVAPCEDKAEIIAALSEAMAVLTSMSAHVLEAALAGDPDGLNAASSGIRQARACEDNLLYVYCHHKREHGC